jgi:ABC-type branched-subunit amino acid transport system substrate-binding protein
MSVPSNAARRNRLRPLASGAQAIAALALVSLAACTTQSVPAGRPPNQQLAVAAEPPAFVGGDEARPVEQAGQSGVAPAKTAIASIPPDVERYGPIAGRPGALKVGLLVPLSGAREAEGKALFDAAQMALFDVGDERFTLLPADTAGTPDGARSAAIKLVDGGAALLIGPLLSDEAKAAAPITRARGINLVSFSNNPSAAGGGVYLLGHLASREVARLIDHARANGLRRFAVLAPADGYGRLVADEVALAVRQRNGELVATVFYPPSGNPLELDRVVQALSGGPAFDALVLPDGGAQLKRVLTLLVQYGIDPALVRLLGTSLWDDRQLLDEPILKGAWYVTPPPEGRASFRARFAQVFGYEPGRIAALGYDATALAIALARQPGGADFGARALTNPGGFSGMEGIFRFAPDGTSERGLAVVEIGADGAVAVVSAAEGRFPSGTQAGVSGQ